MSVYTGNCLCGQVSFKAEGKPKLTANCHCTDCQQVSGSAFATILFMAVENVEITGELKSFDHTVDSGNVLTKEFCPTCGSQIFVRNTGRPGNIGVRAGQINEKGLIKPQFNVFTSSMMPCTVLDETLPAFEKMPS